MPKLVTNEELIAALCQYLNVNRDLTNEEITIVLKGITTILFRIIKKDA